MTRPEKSAASIFDVEGTRAIVTGAASGLGFAMAEALAENGARVALVDRDGALLAEAVATLSESGCTVTGELLDVTDESAVDRVISAIAEKNEGLDVLFANAGISLGSGILSEDGQIENADRDAWARVLDVNLSGVLSTMQVGARVMRRQRSGRIIVTASTAGLGTEAFCSYGYIAAKGGIVNVVRQAALDLARDNVQVNAIAPGPFRTRIGGEHGDDPDVLDYWASTVPLGRMGDPSEIQGVTLLLASRASSFITGTIISVDGGSLVGPPITH